MVTKPQLYIITKLSTHCIHVTNIKFNLYHIIILDNGHNYTHISCCLLNRGRYNNYYNLFDDKLNNDSNLQRR